MRELRRDGTISDAAGKTGKDESEHLLKRLEQRLRSSGYEALRRIRLELVDGAVVLHGRVPSYYLKQLAQESARTLLNGLCLENRIRVGSAARTEIR